MAETWTIAKLIAWCADYFAAKGLVDSPRLDAEILLVHTLNLPRLQLYLQFDRPLDEAELASFKALVKRRALQEPVAYLTGKKEFWSREFAVAPGVLIPRPDTEILVEETLKRIPKSLPDKGLRGLEIGVGTGIIAVTLLAERPGLVMHAVDVCETALACARRNAEKHGVADRLHLVRRDFFSPEPEPSFDFIVSNPPYLDANEMQELPEGIRDFEPREALLGGDDGLAFYRRFADSAPLLNPGGFLAVEIGETQTQAVKTLFETRGWKTLSLARDLSGLDRALVFAPL